MYHLTMCPGIWKENVLGNKVYISGQFLPFSMDLPRIQSTLYCNYWLQCCIYLYWMLFEWKLISVIYISWIYLCHWFYFPHGLYIGITGHSAAFTCTGYIFNGFYSIGFTCHGHIYGPGVHWKNMSLDTFTHFLVENSAIFIPVSSISVIICLLQYFKSHFSTLLKIYFKILYLFKDTTDFTLKCFISNPLHVKNIHY